LFEDVEAARVCAWRIQLSDFKTLGTVGESS
jgi:hypothetical protein